MPTHPYYVALERELFAQLAVVRERARAHKMTIRTHGKDTQPKRFTLKRRGDPDPILIEALILGASLINYAIAGDPGLARTARATYGETDWSRKLRDDRPAL